MKTKATKRPMTVADVAKRLKSYPQDLPVGRVGHFGEFHEMDKFDFHVAVIISGDLAGKSCLAIDAPDIGPDPD